MHLRAQRPVFVPEEHWGEIQKLSKAALMDMVWDYATSTAGEGEDAVDAIMAELRERRDIILTHRKLAKDS